MAGGGRSVWQVFLPHEFREGRHALDAISFVQWVSATIEDGTHLQCCFSGLCYINSTKGAKHCVAFSTCKGLIAESKAFDPVGADDEL